MFAWHVHHARLYETVQECGLEQRRQYIGAYKPAKERSRRLRLLALVKNQVLLDSLISASRAASLTLRVKVRQIIDDLHREECKRCTWDGETIFPKRLK